jgi:hypothetical protein
MISGFNKVNHQVRKLLEKTSPINILYLACAVVISAQLLITTQTHPKAGWPTLYNNYVIFRMSFTHLIQGADLYQAYPYTYFDLYKYSPAFAIMMAPFGLIPDLLGLPLWNMLNAFVLLMGIRKLSALDIYRQNLLLLFLLPELVISLQNAQSNALVAGLMLLAFNYFESRQAVLATLMLAIGTMVKIFPLAGFLLLFLYPEPVKAMIWGAVWLLLLLLAPLPFCGTGGIIHVYAGWFELLKNDHSLSTGLSIFAWLESWTGLTTDKNQLLVLGAGLLCLCLLVVRLKPELKAGKQLFLALLLIWLVIFNHKAESPTFIIAMTGVGLWYFFSENVKVLGLIMLVAALIFTSLSPSDLFPAGWKNGWVKDGVWKAFPIIIVWGLLSIRLCIQPIFLMASNRFRKTGTDAS